jgi:hypothetical protein
VLRYQRGLFLPEPRLGSLEMAAAEQKADEIFYGQIVQFNRQGQNTSAKRNAPTYAPAEFQGKGSQRRRTEKSRP